MEDVRPRQVAPSPPPGQTLRRVLVLDDDPGMVRLLTDYLRAPHLHVVTCTEIEAAECLLEHLQFDVLVSDLEVSDLGGLEGMRLIRHAAFHFPDTDVVAFSGRLDDNVRRLAQALGATAVLAKPADLPQLRAFVDRGIVEERRPSPIVEGETSRVQALEEVLGERTISALLQPIVSIADTTSEPRPFGVEGLARGPARSLLHNPEILLGYASRKAMLFETELQCIEAVLREARELPEDGKLFINVRPRSLSAPDAAGELLDVVRQAGRRASQVVLELTEQQTILNPRAFHGTLRALQELGFRTALDDYGQGFANLHLVQELRPDYLKIDGFFCSDLHLDPRKQAMVRSTVEMARELGISTIMEHVESQAELEAVSKLGVSYAQGYHFSKPVPGGELASWFHAAALPVSAPAVRPVAPPSQADQAQPDDSPAANRAMHELNNQLTAIALCASFASGRLPADDPNRAEFEQINRAAEAAIEQSRKLDAERAGAEPVLLVDVA